MLTLDRINFPAEFIEGYAYLQNNMYGAKTGKFYNEHSVQLWMPSGLISTNNVELNYISGRKGRSLFLAFTNQSNSIVKSSVSLNSQFLKINSGISSYALYEAGKRVKQGILEKNNFYISVPANGLVVLRIDQVDPKVAFQNNVQKELPIVKNDKVSINLGNANAYSFRMGNISKAYVFLKADDNQFTEVTLSYKTEKGKRVLVKDKKYPFEFTIDLPNGENKIELQLEGLGKDGKIQTSTPVILGM